MSPSGESGRARTPREPVRGEPADARQSAGDGGGAADGAATPAGARRGAASRRRARQRRRRRTRAAQHQMSVQPTKQSGKQATTVRKRGQADTRRSKRRRSTTAEGTGQARRRSQRLRTVNETSAGGLVVDLLTSRAALIGRLDRRGRLLWSLPKGHIEHGESAEQAAVREVAEETGIDSAVIATLGSIEYWFVAEDRRVHKTVHHFLLRALGGELSDEDVEVTEVAWVPLPEVQGRLAYADERRLVRRATDLLAESA